MKQNYPQATIFMEGIYKSLNESIDLSSKDKINNFK